MSSSESRWNGDLKTWTNMIQGLPQNASQGYGFNSNKTKSLIDTIASYNGYGWKMAY